MRLRRLKTTKTPEKVTDFPLVLVTWIDAALDPASHGSTDSLANDFGGLMECQDVGFLVEITPDSVILAISICPDDGSYRHSNTLPNGWVRSIVELSPNGTICSGEPSPRASKEAPHEDPA